MPSPVGIRISFPAASARRNCSVFFTTTPQFSHDPGLVGDEEQGITDQIDREHMGDLDSLVRLALAGHDANVRATRSRDNQNSALPGVRANGMTSRIFATPVTNMSMRSKPSPKPACGTVP